MLKKKLSLLQFALLWFFVTGGVAFWFVVYGYALTTHRSVWQVPFGLRAKERVMQRETTAAGVPKEITMQLESADARIPLVHNFLSRYNSPIVKEDPEFARFLVELADKNQMDFRLLPAIAMQESNLCKVVPEGSHNCLGLGVHKRGTWGFATYRDNFTAAAKILKENYIDKGLTTTELIESKYNPSSAQRDGSWASAVNQFMAEMRYDDRKLGKEKKTDADLLEFIER